MSVEENGFYTAILQNPDDDTVRLVYADWLEEHGDTDRAEFIRTQCWLATLTADDPQREPLETHAGELLDRHRKEWESPLRELGAERIVFRRGLPASVVMRPGIFLKHAEELFRRTPSITALHLSGKVTDTLARQLAACTQLSHLAELWVEGGSWKDRQTATLVTSPHLKHLQELHIRRQVAGEETAQALAEAAHLSSLRILDFTGNRIGTAGAVALAGSAHLRNLKTLCLASNAIGDEGAVALSQSSHLKGLELLDLASNRLSDAAAQALVLSPRLRGIKALGLDGNYGIDPEVGRWAARIVARRPWDRPIQR